MPAQDADVEGMGRQLLFLEFRRPRDRAFSFDDLDHGYLPWVDVHSGHRAARRPGLSQAAGKPDFADVVLDQRFQPGTGPDLDKPEVELVGDGHVAQD